MVYILHENALEHLVELNVCIIYGQFATDFLEFLLGFGFDSAFCGIFNVLVIWISESGFLSYILCGSHERTTRSLSLSLSHRLACAGWYTFQD